MVLSEINSEISNLFRFLKTFSSSINPRNDIPFEIISLKNLK